MLRPVPYLSQKLTQPLPTKDGGTLRTVLDARTYMLALSKGREVALNGNGQPNCFSRKLLLPTSAGRSSWRYSMMLSSILRNDSTQARPN